MHVKKINNNNNKKSSICNGSISNKKGKNVVA